MNYFFDSIIRIFIAVLCFSYALIFMSRRDGGSPLQHFGLAEFFIGLWCLFDGIQGLLPQGKYIPEIQSVIYIAAELAVYSLFMFSYKFTVRKDRHNIRIANLSLVFPVITIIAFLVFGYDIFLGLPDNFESIDYFLPGYFYPKHMWYYMHCAYCYIVLAVTIVSFIYKSIVNFQENKRMFMLMAAGVVVFLIQNVNKFIVENFLPEMFESLPEYFNACCILFMVTITFFALYYDSNEKAINQCKRSLFDSAGAAVFIFNMKNLLLQMNSTGFDFMKQHGVEVEKFKAYNEIFSENDFQKLGIPKVRDNLKSYYLSSVKTGSLFYCKIMGIFTGMKKQIGYAIILYDFDFYSGVIEQLEKAAYTDFLTGCINRSVFNQRINGDIQKSASPLLFVAAGIDNLSEMNEKIGYNSTDQYIKVFSEIIRSSIDAQHDIFRMNGSTFVFILSFSEESKIPEIFRKIRNSCAHYSKTRTFPLVCSLGYSVTDGAGLDAQEYYHQAFKNMLLDRRSHVKNPPAGLSD